MKNKINLNKTSNSLEEINEIILEDSSSSFLPSPSPLSLSSSLNNNNNNRRLSSSRRLSGGRRLSNQLNNDDIDQNKIAEMYKTIIQLSSENKINTKNSWNLDLINHMDKIIREESYDKNGKNVNFQKASCTIDASIKIYSNRVDDTWNTSYRILENLNRNDNNNGNSKLYDDDDCDDDNDNDNNDGNNGEQNNKNIKKTRKSNKSKSSSSTIEKNVQNINLSPSDMAGASPHADPMFHKMSQVFDEGGAKGMLLTNLRVTPQTSTLIFSSDVITTTLSSSTTTTTTTTSTQGNEDSPDINSTSRNLLNRCSFTLPSLQNLIENPSYLHSKISFSPCGDYLSQYRNDTNLFPSYFQSSEMNDLLSLPNSYPTHSADKNEKKRLSSSRRRSSIMVLSDNLDEENDNNNDNNKGYNQNDEYTPLNLGMDNGDDDDDCDDDCGDFGGGMDFVCDDYNQDDDIELSNTLIQSTPSQSKLQWDSVFDQGKNDNSTSSNRLSSSSISILNEKRLSSSRQSILPSSADWSRASFGYASLPSNEMKPLTTQFANLALNSNTNPNTTLPLPSLSLQINSWAGAKHWKSKLRVKLPKTIEEGDNDDNDENDNDNDNEKNEKTKIKEKKSRVSKKKFQFNFSDLNSDISDEINTVWKPEGRKQDPRVFSNIIIEKMKTKSNELILPEDQKVEMKDLCRLSQWDSMIVLPHNISKEVAQNLVASCTTSSMQNINGYKKEIDTIWIGSSSISTKNRNNDDLIKSNQYENDNDDEVYDNGIDFGCNDNDDDDNGDDIGFSGDNFGSDEVIDTIPETTGLEIAVKGGLLEANRKVEKISIGYETTSKRVNVRKLKHDMWNLVDDQLPSISKKESIESNTLSFQTLLSQMLSSSSTRQQDASLSFYFISLLHLANEKNLHIEDNISMSDLVITREQ